MENTRRNFNTFYLAFHLILIIVAILNQSSMPLIFNIVIFMFQGFTNVTFLLNNNEISATNIEIINASTDAPKWFKKRMDNIHN